MLIGREPEKRTLLETLHSDESEFVAVYGRRRVGKTFLVRESFGGRFAFEHTGMSRTPMKGQLAAFRESLVRAGLKPPRGPLRTWQQAFSALATALERLGSAKKVVFLDELPWMDTQASRLLPALEHFWNGWAAPRKDVVLVVCGSASSWIASKLLHGVGGLYNRVTRSIFLQPFSLGECARYAAARGLALGPADIAEARMALGGIPFYWRQLVPGLPLAQNFDRLFFASGAPLRNEFSQLYASLFRQAENHLRIVRALGARKSGVSRDDLLRATAIPPNGRFSAILGELEQCDFVRRIPAAGKKRKDALWQLADPFSLFHLQFIEGDPAPDPRFWSASAASPRIAAWRGLAFERLCADHILQIKAALGISGVLTRIRSWRHLPDAVHPDGAQIDLLVERADCVVDLCEMKWADGPFALDKDEALKLLARREVYRAVTGTRFAVRIVLATPFGLKPNAHSSIVQAVVTLEDLLKDA